MEDNQQKSMCVILGGVRGDDKLGLAVLTYYFKFPHQLFQLLVGNYQAIEKNVPYLDFDLLRAGKGDITCTTSIEKCRAGELHEVLKDARYAVDIHGTHAQDDLVVIFNNDPETIRFAQSFGVKKCILLKPDNYLLESVPHAVTYIQSVMAKPQPETKDISRAIMVMKRIEQFFSGEAVLEEAMRIFEYSGQEENALGRIIDGKISQEDLKELS